MRVGYYQFRPLFGRPKRNLDKVTAALDGVSADLIVLPELAFTGYWFSDRTELMDLAEDPEDSPTVAGLVELCKTNHLHLVTGFAERCADQVYNSALLIGPGGVEHVYRKLHLFNEEKRLFDPGDIPLCVQRVGTARIGIMVCFDWVFPEVTRSLALQGADLICHPSNLVLHYCQQTMLTRCLENHVFAVTANRFGADKRPHGELRFTGKSQVVAPDGELIQRAASQREVLYTVEIDLAKAREKRITPHNDVLGDRRPEFYRL